MLVNVNVGLCEKAKEFFVKDSINQKYSWKAFEQLKVLPGLKESYVNYRTGTNHSIELYTYVFDDGTIAEEFVQAIFSVETGQIVHFLGLNVKDQTILWRSKDIREKINEIVYNNSRN